VEGIEAVFQDVCHGHRVKRSLLDLVRQGFGRTGEDVDPLRGRPPTSVFIELDADDMMPEGLEGPQQFTITATDVADPRGRRPDGVAEGRRVEVTATVQPPGKMDADSIEGRGAIGRGVGLTLEFLL
jgi:hypothetical protein